MLSRRVVGKLLTSRPCNYAWKSIHYAPLLSNNKPSSLSTSNFQLCRYSTTTASVNTSVASTSTPTTDYEKEEEKFQKGKPILEKWLLILSGMVVTIVLVGGLTRLTESGLSMVDWNLMGKLPPITTEEWEKEFEKYKQFPEYKKKNEGMSLSEFKYIFYFEYIHRQIGRVIGATFLLPAAYFWQKGYFNRLQLKGRVFGIASLIGFQGLLGWYMVKSGLDENHELMQKYNNVPRVSQYRLASHLGTAFIIYASMIWTYLDVRNYKPATATPTSYPVEVLKQFKLLKRTSVLTAAIVFITVMSGAFVAGMDAGLVYNEFPKMGGRWIPSDMFALSPTLVNFFENATTVQFDHRVLATITSVLIFGLFFYGRRIPHVPQVTKSALHAAVAVVTIQYLLGLTTLLTYVPVSVASAHQIGSLTLFTTMLWLLHVCKRLPK